MWIDLELGFDRADQVAHSSSRWAEVPGWAFRAAAQAQPQAVWGEELGYARHESLAVFGVIADVEAATIEHELKVGPRELGSPDEVSHFEGYVGPRTFGLRSLDRQRRYVDRVPRPSEFCVVSTRFCWHSTGDPAAQGAPT